MCDYWTDRKEFNYYKKTIELATRFASDAESVIEVGAGRTKLLEEITWVKEKIAIDLERKPTIQGALNIHADFMKYKAKKCHDLVFCLQVLEHLTQPELFMKKLLQTGKKVIISVPYEWPEGLCIYHVQDPVSNEKVLQWAGKDWLHSEIVDDAGMKRLVAVFDGSC
jgi:hypothetical protein